jgi:hypothetical protein
MSMKAIFKHSRSIDVLALLLLALLVSRGWFNSGFMKGHDAFGGIIMSQSLLDSLHHFPSFPNYSDYSYLGAPLFSSFPPGVYFIHAALVGILGASLGTKALFFILFWLAGVFMYFFVRSLTNSRPASLIAALFYTYNGYALEEFIFEAHGELLLAFTLTPLLFWQLERTISKPSVGRATLCGICLAFLIVSAPQAFPLLVGPFFMAYVVFHLLVSFKSRTEALAGLRALLIVLAVALFLSAFWWLPALGERTQMYSTSYAKADSLQYTATFWQAITLRPHSCCSNLAPSSANALYISVWQMIGVVLVALGIGLNYKNKRVWFFVAMIVVGILLALGLQSPINLYGFGFDHLPFFRSIRTPGRFLFFTTFCYAALAGYAVVALEKLIKSNIKRVVLIAVLAVLIVGNVWSASQQAFQTFRLSSDQENAYAWLKDQEDGDYRITDLPFQTWVYSPETRNIVDPVNWIFLHGKETVSGGAPALATKYTGNTLDSLNTDIVNNKSNIGEWLNVLNVKYVILDKTDPLYSNIVLGDGFEKVQTFGDIEIYQNKLMEPRIFMLSSPTNERVIDLWEGNTIKAEWADGNQAAMLSLDSAHSTSSGYSLKCVYRFTNPWGEWTNLRINVQGIHFGQDDAIHLKFYSEEDLPDIYITLDVFEQDGSRYGIDLRGGDVIKAGWNEINFPLSLLNLRYSSDENDHLDFDQITTLWFGVGEQKNFDKVHEFALCFDELSIVSYKMTDNVEYTKISPGKYEVHLDSDGASYLVLTDSYDPNWVAKMDGQTIPSSIAFGFANSWQIDQAGEHDLVLEFAVSSQRKAGRIISLMTAIGLVGFFVGREIKVRRRKRPRRVTGA